jgi:hypothetical protein
MINLRRIYGRVVAEFEVLSRPSPGETGKNDEKLVRLVGVPEEIRTG